MTTASKMKQYLKMKPEVSKIFDDLEEWLDYCRINLIKYDQADLYKSTEYKAWQKERNPTKRVRRESKKQKAD